MRAASLKTMLGIALLVSVVALPAYAQSRVETGSKVLALERLWGEAAQMRDTRALAAIFEDGLIYVRIDGRLMTKPDVLADTASSPLSRSWWTHR